MCNDSELLSYCRRETELYIQVRAVELNIISRIAQSVILRASGYAV